MASSPKDSGRGHSGFLLIGLSQGVRGQSWPLPDQPVTIGRGRDCDICVPHPAVSRTHCEISVRQNRFFLRNCSGKNTLLLNGEFVHQAEGRLGDEVTLGPVTFMVVPIGCEVARDATEDSPGSTEDNDILWELPEPSEHAQHHASASLEDLTFMFRICREAAGADSVAELLSSLAHNVRRKYTPRAIWIHRYDDATESLRPVSGLDSNYALSDAPIEKILRAMSAGKAMVMPLRRSDESSLLFVIPVQTKAAMPLALAMQTDPMPPSEAETRLRFLAMLAVQLTPILTMIERAALPSNTLKGREDQNQANDLFIGYSVAAQHIRRMALIAASTDLPVLILGETGVGKEVIARLIHNESPRATGQWVVCNCPAISESLFESELFGHRRGAFTGAMADHKGLFEQADGGTLFLDEISDLSSRQQAKILRVLENSTLRRVGDSVERSINVRIIAAANVDLHSAVSKGQFREDLFHRLCGMEIFIPPLRERNEDIAPLAELFVAQANKTISKCASDYLSSYHWPGNVRELRQTISRSVLLCSGDTLNARDIALGSRAEAMERPRELGLSLANVEREHIRQVLEQADGNKTVAASILGIGRDTLRRKLQQYELEDYLTYD